MVRNRLSLLVGLITILTLILAACTPAAPEEAAEPTEPQAAATETGGEEAEEPTSEAAAEEPTSEAAAEEPTSEAAAEEPDTDPTMTDIPYQLGIFEDLTAINFWDYLGPSTSTWDGYVLGPQAISMMGLADKTFALVPLAAAELPERPLEQEGEFYVSEVPLKEGITWSDGTPVTANDVAFTINTSLELQLTGNWASFIDSEFVDRAEAVDDYTVKYYYTENPGLAVHEYGTLTAPIMAEAYWGPIVEQARESVGALEPPAEDAAEEELQAYQEALNEALSVLYSHDPEGEPKAGAFMLSNREAGAFAESAANPEYFRSGAEVNVYANGAYEEVKEGAYEDVVGEPVSEEIVNYTVGPYTPATIHSIYSDQNASLLALQQGEIDIVLSPNGLQKGLRAQVEAQDELQVIDNPTNGFRYLSFNMRRAPMDDKAFRQAVAVLIDKEFVTQQILQGVAYPIYSFVPEGNEFWYTDDVPKYGLNEDGTSMTREERLNEAIRLLEEAGYSWEGDEKPTWDADNQQVVRGGTLVLPDGETMTELELLSPGPGYDPLRSTYAIWIEQWLNEFGIPVRANLTGFNVILDRTDQLDFDMFILGWGLSIFPDYVRDFFHSDRAAPGDFNAGGYTNPEFDELANGIKSCTTFDECKEIADEIQQTLAEELPYVVLFATSITEVYSDELDFPYTETLDGLQNLYGFPSAVTME
jgi:ABC-type transport system substrate-binding protein